MSAHKAVTIKYEFLDRVPEKLIIKCVPQDIRSWYCKVFHSKLIETHISHEGEYTVMDSQITKCTRCDV